MFCNIHPQQPLNKPVHKTFGDEKKKERCCGVPFAFSFQQLFPFVEDLLKAYLIIYQHIIYHIQQFNKISEVFKHVFGDSVIATGWAMSALKWRKGKARRSKTALLRTENVWICDRMGVLMNGCIDE